MLDAWKTPEWLGVSRETERALAAFCQLVIKWNPAVNLISKSTVNDVWYRHLLDSAQLFSLADTDAKSWVDLGSGAGFPGLIIAILAAEHRPDLTVFLVESDRRKAVFLSQAVRQLGLSAQIICERIEKLSPMNAEILSARALASLDVLCGYARQHLIKGGAAIFPKGAAFANEIDDARQRWSFSVSVTPSKTDPVASILVLKDIKNAK